MRRLSEVVDFEVLLLRDHEMAARQGQAALLVRDRTLAAQLPPGAPHRRLRKWVELRRALETGLPGRRAEGIVSLVGWLLAWGGLVLGAGTATALLAYDGRAPVNVLAWLLYTAAIPLALAVLLGVGLLTPRRWLSRGGAAQALLGAVVAPLLRRLPGGPNWSRELLGRTGQGQRTLERWLLVGLTQIFTLGFLGAALVTLLVTVTITDLTFAWSTTLKMSDADVARWVRVLASPWAELYPDAVPDAEAVARSNYRRFVERFRDTETRTPVEVAIGATWWKLSAAAVLVYGILPRLLFLLLASWRWRRGLSRWPALERPEVRSLLERFEDPGGSFSARRSGAPQLRPASPTPDSGPTRSSSGEPTPHQFIVAWGAAAAEPMAAAGALKQTPETLLTAGTDLDLRAERAVLSAAAQKAAPVTVLVPREEPPVEDVLSFLRELRAVVPRVVVVPIVREGDLWRAVHTDPAWGRALANLQGIEAPAT